ncbi:MAG: M48 family metallopeptidase [Candidatus Pacebacteria bacterium]|nr:M48 family metallopeptidase [Candidatus Paceibacterota bacterium]
MQVKVFRSYRRKKTVSAKEINGTICLYLPQRLSIRDEKKYVQWARSRIKASLKKKSLQERNRDKLLEKRAQELNQKYFHGKLSWTKISYSSRQNKLMFGNCNPRKRIIRISDRLLKMPRFVQDYLIIHELAHLKIAGHSPKFWQLVNRFPKTERARGFLMAASRQK